MKKLVKNLVCILIALTLVGGFAFAAGGRQATQPAASGTLRVGIILKTLANPFWVTMQEGILAEAQRQGVEVNIYSVQSEEDLIGQLQLFETILGRGYDGIGFAPLSAVNLVPAAARAFQMGIPLVNIDERVDMTQLRNAGGNVFAFITTDNEAVGAQGAQFIVSQITSGQVAIIEGRSGNASGEARRAGAARVFEAAPGVTLVASQPADWDRSRALDVTTNLLQRFPDLRAIYAANDTMALGAMQAVANAGRQDQVVIVGTDGVDEAVQMVKDGRLAATVGQDPAEVGAESLRQLLFAIRNNVSINLADDPRFIAVDSRLITR